MPTSRQKSLRRGGAASLQGKSVAIRLLLAGGVGSGVLRAAHRGLRLALDLGDERARIVPGFDEDLVRVVAVGEAL